MGKVIDLTGQIFNQLTVVERDRTKIGIKQGAVWLCKCNCGNPNLISVSAGHLKSGHTKSCGKCFQFKMIGQKFNNLTVLRYNEKYTKEKDDESYYYDVECDCEKHTVFTVRGASLRSGNTKSCGCIKSLGEANIQKTLQENNISFEKEKTYDNLISDKGQHYRYDFYLLEYNRLIEFDGEQHYEYSNNGWNTKKEFKKRQQSDKIKNEYALSHNIPLVRIPFWERDNITLEILLGDKYLITNLEDVGEEEIIF